MVLNSLFVRCDGEQFLAQRIKQMMFMKRFSRPPGFTCADCFRLEYASFMTVSATSMVVIVMHSVCIKFVASTVTLFLLFAEMIR